MWKFLYFCLCLTAPVLGSEICLKEKLSQAQSGSYLVLEQNRMCTFLNIHETHEKNIVIEEVSIPSVRFPKNFIGWKEWFEKGAPGHTSWMLSQMNLETGVFEETFSFTHQGWIDISASNPFLTTLMNLRFHEISKEERRKVGLPPGYHKVDRRPLWNPPFIVKGAILPNTPFSAYKARWPSDGTELARKTIEIYLPNPQASMPDFPVYFPYWLEVDGKIGSAKIRVIDSGINAHSPKGHLPKRVSIQTSIGEAVELVL